MVMTLDEYIKREKEKAEHAKEEYLLLQDDNFTDIEIYEKRLNNCANFAEDHEQIAEWLEDYKVLREKTQIQNEGLTDAYLLGKYDGIKQGRADAIEKIIELAHEDATTGNMVINLADVEKLKNSKEKTDDKRL